MEVSVDAEPTEDHKRTMQNYNRQFGPSTTSKEGGDKRTIDKQTSADFKWDQNGGKVRMRVMGETRMRILKAEARRNGSGPIDADGNIILIRRGHKGKIVKMLQLYLNLHNYKVAEDSKFGPEVQKAVKEFQTDRELSVDGLVGPLTWDK